MEKQLFLTVFVTIFLAEIGDKTQIATMLYAAGTEHSKLTVFLGAALALVLASGIGVLAGSFLSKFLDKNYLSYIAGVGFIIVGVWTIIKA